MVLKNNYHGRYDYNVTGTTPAHGVWKPKYGPIKDAVYAPCGSDDEINRPRGPPIWPGTFLIAPIKQLFQRELYRCA